MLLTRFKTNVSLNILLMMDLYYTRLLNFPCYVCLVKYEMITTPELNYKYL